MPETGAGGDEAILSAEAASVTDHSLTNVAELMGELERLRAQLAEVRALGELTADALVERARRAESELATVMAALDAWRRAESLTDCEACAALGAADPVPRRAESLADRVTARQ